MPNHIDDHKGTAGVSPAKPNASLPGPTTMIPRQGYAPTPHSYIPNTNLSATINLDEVRPPPLASRRVNLANRDLCAQEVKLTNTRAERDLQDSLAELFSIIVTLDELEKAFIKDAVPETEYTDICERSLRQYKALLADETIAREFQGIEEFKAKFDVRHIYFGHPPRHPIANLLQPA